jgi:hypothetical protein
MGLISFSIFVLFWAARLDTLYIRLVFYFFFDPILCKFVLLYGIYLLGT